jgi:hypothetical protein
VYSMFKIEKDVPKGHNRSHPFYFMCYLFHLAKMHLTETNEMSKPYYINVYNLLCVNPQPIALDV